MTKNNDNSFGYYHHQRGLSLIELMVAITIGLILLIGAGNIYVKSQATYNNNESIARLQETARYALNVIEGDIRAANYQGYAAVQTFGPNNIVGASPHVDANQTSPSPTTPTVNSIANSAAVTACGVNFAVDFEHYVQGDNDGLLPDDQGGGAGLFSASRNTASCAPLNDNQVATSDTLTIRGVSDVCDPGALQIVSQVGYSSLLTSGTPCTNTQTTQVDSVMVHAYYVDNDSDQQTGLSSLRRFVLDSTSQAFRDEEVISGVEDFQVQFGIETSSGGSNPQFKGIASQYVNPNDPVLNSDTVRVVTVRVWVLVRGDSIESGGFTDNLIYEYGDRSKNNGKTGDLNATSDRGFAYQPSLSSTAKKFRRLLISKTFQIRNSQASQGYNL